MNETIYFNFNYKSTNKIGAPIIKDQAHHTENITHTGINLFLDDASYCLRLLFATHTISRSPAFRIPGISVGGDV